MLILLIEYNIRVHQNTSQGITESDVRELEKYLTRDHRVGCQGAREISLINVWEGTSC